MDSLVERLELIAAWHTPGGPTPKQKRPAIHTNVREAIARIAALEAALAKMQRSRDRYREAWEAEKARDLLTDGGDDAKG